MRVFLLHAPEGVLDARIAPGQPPRERALLADPLVHPRLDRSGLALGQPLGRGSEALDGDEPGDAVRVDPGVAERDVAPRGWAVVVTGASRRRWTSWGGAVVEPAHVLLAAVGPRLAPWPPQSGALASQ